MRLPLAMICTLHFLFGTWLALIGYASIGEAWEMRQLYERYDGNPPLQFLGFDGPTPLTLPMFVNFAAWGIGGFAFAASALGVWFSVSRAWGWTMLALMSVRVSLGLVDTYLFTIHLPELSPWHRVCENAADFAWLAFVARALQIGHKL